MASSVQMIPLSAESRPGKLKSIIEIIGKIFSPQAEKTRIVLLSRERIEELISEFPEGEAIIRQDILERFERMNEKATPKDLSWFEIQELFEYVFKRNTDEKAREILSEGLGYSRELLTKVMHCVGRGQHLEAKQSA